MYKIHKLNKLSPSGTEIFDRKKYSFSDELNGSDAVIVRSSSMHELELDKSIKAIARAGAGVNNIPIERCSQLGIVVFNTPGANANAVKELVVAGLLLSSRKVVPSMEWVKTIKGNGDQVGKMVEQGKGAFIGPELYGKSIGVIGLGAIGVMVANIATHLGMKVFGYDPYVSVKSAWNLSRSVEHTASIKDIYASCDYLSLHVPLNNETKHMINEESIKSMKDGVRILNFSRAELVADTDIIAALELGKVSSYVTDFPTDEVIGQSGVIAIPHLGASTPESEDNCASMAAEQVIDFLENGNIKNSVNLPDVDLPRSGGVRVCIIHKNIPTMLSQISACLAESGVNITDLINKSKKELAYTIVDVEADDFPSDALTSIQNCEGVITVRKIL